MNKNKAREYNISLRSNVEAWAKATGFKVLKSGMTYHDTGFRFRVELLEQGAEDPSVADWNQWAEMYGFKKEDLGRTFTNPMTGDKYTITGLRSRNRKYPVLAKSDRDGKTYKFSTTVKNRLDT